MGGGGHFDVLCCAEALFQFAVDASLHCCVDRVLITPKRFSPQSVLSPHSILLGGGHAMQPYQCIF
jgi:hypothetical protein